MFCFIFLNMFTELEDKGERKKHQSVAPSADQTAT